MAVSCLVWRRYRKVWVRYIGVPHMYEPYAARPSQSVKHFTLGEKSTSTTHHIFRVPLPDLSVKLGTPNACNDCHGDRSGEWAASANRAMVRSRTSQGRDTPHSFVLIEKEKCREGELVHIRGLGTSLYRLPDTNAHRDGVYSPRGDTIMFTKSALALTIVLATVTGALATTKNVPQ